MLFYTFIQEVDNQIDSCSLFVFSMIKLILEQIYKKEEKGGDISERVYRNHGTCGTPVPSGQTERLKLRSVYHVAHQCKV